MRTAAGAAVALALLPGAAGAATISVDTTADEFGDGSDCSLREAIQAANTNANFDGCAATGYGADTVAVPDGIFDLTRIGSDDTNSAGDLDITGGGLVVDGIETAGHTLISGSFATRIVDLRSGGATIQQVELAAGSAVSAAGGAISTEAGTSLTVDDAEIRESSAGTDGGGIRAKGSLTVTGSEIRDNGAGGANLGGAIGGGIAYQGSAGTDALAITDTTISGNDVLNAGGNGAGLAIALTAAGQDLDVASTDLTSNGFDGGERGGGIYMQSPASDTLEVSDSRLFQNFVSHPGATSAVGGAIYVQGGDLTLDSSEVKSNQTLQVGTASGIGGGVYLGGDGRITDSIISDNAAVGNAFGTATGGGVQNSGGDLEVRGSTISGNDAVGATQARGGGLDNEPVPGGGATIVNTTVSGNGAFTSGANTSRGGGISAGTGDLDLIHSTVAANTAETSGGDAVFAAAGTLTARGSVLDGADPADVCGGAVASEGFNVARGTSCGLDSVLGDGDVQNVNPQLGALADNGGTDVGLTGLEQPLLTQALGATSAAVDRVPAASCENELLDPLPVDERGFPRPHPTDCDSGAYERIACLGAAARMVGTPAGETLTGTPFADVIVGLGGADTISGGAGDDRLCGDTGDDTLDEGPSASGSDQLGGGAGTDRVSYQGRANAIAADIGGADLDGEDCPDGDNCEGDVIAPDVEEIEGGSGADLLAGDGGADGLIGNGGDDRLIGGPGPDALLGLAGSDTASYEERTAAEPVTATVGALGGNGGAADGAGDNLANGVENLAGGAGADSLTGDGNVNALSGGAGADRLDGRGGADPLDGGDDPDTAVYSTGGAVNVNLATGAVSGAQGGDSLTLIENATGSAQADALVGNPGANVLDGAGGNDTLTGAGGLDLLRLGAGGDVAAALDGLSDTIDCTGGGTDTATVDTTPPETYVACPNSDGDALLDLLDACPTQAGTMANGCPVSKPKPKPRRCRKGYKRRHGRCVRDKHHHHGGHHHGGHHHHGKHRH